MNGLREVTMSCMLGRFLGSGGPLVCLVLCLWCHPRLSAADEPAKTPPSIEKKTEGMTRHDGFFPFYWDETAGRIWLEIPNQRGEFLHSQWLATGLGSNPVGLDRGQLGGTRVVRFERVGPKILLVEPNQRYRAESDSAAERRAVEESFAQSVIWGGTVAAESEGRVLVDLTGFLLADRHGVVDRLKQRKQGNFSLDASRSALYLPRSKSFLKNTEFEVTLTFSGNEPGRHVNQTAPTPKSVTLRQHHSLIALPEPGYQPRGHDPRAASFGPTFADYAAPLDEPIEKRYIARHRLKKKDPSAAVSEAVEPIVYYLDAGVPEPARSALLDGARWWNEAFESAGYRDAFRVELLPEGADPLDVRYNIIQWVHRSTRGWSYGTSIADPRTGEILKGVVTLGSLRVRQDRLLFEGLMAPFPAAERLASLDPATSTVEVALARLRQLSAHEVGHTLGFAHNFAASSYGRASVMDYPAPQVKITDSGKLDLSDAYGVGIGEWDKFSVQYAYSDFPQGTDEGAALGELVRDSIDRKLLFVPNSGIEVHPLASMWDNGEDPIAEFKHVMQVRRVALLRFGQENIPEGRPLWDLQSTLVPLYLHHRYQVLATAKMLDGVYFQYAVRGDGQIPVERVAPARQLEALRVLLRAVQPAELALSKNIRDLIPPVLAWETRDEPFPSRQGNLFDPLAAAEIAADLTVSAVLNTKRAVRLVAQHSHDSRNLSLEQVIVQLLAATWRRASSDDAYEAAVQRAVDWLVIRRLEDLATDGGASEEVRAIASSKLRGLLARVPGMTNRPAAHRTAAAEEIERFLSRPHAPAVGPRKLTTPPGSPI